MNIKVRNNGVEGAIRLGFQVPQHYMVWLPLFEMHGEVQMTGF